MYELFNLKEPAKYGIIKDVKPYDLPAEAWSDGQNVRFREGRAEKVLGSSSVLGTPSVAPYWAMPVKTATTYYWLYANLAKVYVTDGTTHTNLTRQTAAVDVDYAATADINWNGGVIGQIPFLNNGIDPPQMWNPLSTAQRLTPLPFVTGTSTWTSLGYKARVLRQFKNWIVAMDFDDGSARYRNRVIVSDAADGTVPASWDWSDPATQAIRFDLDGTTGDIIDSLPLRDMNVIYKDDSAWGMQWIGGNDLWRRFEIFKEDGILSRRCVKAFKGQHVVLTTGDLVIHSGQDPQSIISDRMRTWLFNNISTTNYERCFIVPNYRDDEFWICFPQEGSSFPDMALVWNWKHNTFGVKELPGVAHIAYGVVDTSAADTTWSGDTDTWDSDTTAWGEKSYNPSTLKPLICDTTNTLFQLGDDTNQVNGTNMTVFLERIGHDFGDEENIKFVTELWPRISGTDGGIVTVRVGGQMDIGDAVSWSPVQTYTIGTTQKIDCRVKGRYISVRYDSTTDVDWRLSGQTFKGKISGRY